MKRRHLFPASVMNLTLMETPFRACRSTAINVSFEIHVNRYDETHVLVTRHFWLDTLPLAHVLDNLSGHGGLVERAATRQDLPVVEHHLRERLTTSVRAEVSVETERLVDGEVSLDVEQRSTGTLSFLEDVTSPAGEHRVDTTHSLLGNLNLDQEDRLLDTRVGEQGGGVEHTPGSGDDLTTTTVNGIGVEGDIHDVETNGTHWLFGNGTFLGGPLETGDNGILDFVEVLHSLGLVDEQVGAGGLRTEAPNLSGIGDVPTVVVSEDPGTSLEIVTRADSASLNVLANLLRQRGGGDVETVVLVGRLGQSSHARVTTDGLTVRHDGVGNAERHTSVVLLKILQANLQVKLTGTGNDVLTRLSDHGQDARVRLAETLETFDELGKIVGVLDFDGTLDNRRDGELHDLQVVGSLGGSKSTRLEQELVNTDKTKNVTSWHILDGLSETAHHENSTLDRLDEQVLLLAGNVVRTLNADLETRADGTSEDTTESVETTLIGSGHHLGDVKHQSTLGVAVADGNSGLVVVGTLVESLHTVLLGDSGRWQVEDHHLHESVGSGKELPHDDLQELLAGQFLLVTGELDLKLLEELGDLVSLEVHDRVEDTENGVQAELVESTLELLTVVLANLGPLLGLGVEVVVALFIVSFSSLQNY